MEDASIKVSWEASSLNTVSARAMLAALIETETNPLQLANLATGRMQKECSAGRVLAIIPVVQSESALGLATQGFSAPSAVASKIPDVTGRATHHVVPNSKSVGVADRQRLWPCAGVNWG